MKGHALKAVDPTEVKLPLEYTAACSALQCCQTIDESRYWDNKADALAAWARIYRHNEAGRLARQLKLHAYRRMGTLAQELRKGRSRSVLIEHGLKPQEADAARKLSNMEAESFDRLLSLPRPPTPTTVRNQRVRGSFAWLVFGGSSNDNGRAFRAFCRRHKAQLLARSLSADEHDEARAIAGEIMGWIYEFRRNLQKGSH